MGINLHRPDDVHYLRTHLTVIRGYTQLALRDAVRAHDPSDPLVGYLQFVLTRIVELTKLVAEIEVRESSHTSQGENTSERSESPDE